MFPSVSAIFPLSENRLNPELLHPHPQLLLSLFSMHVTLLPLILATTRPLLFKIVSVSLELFPQLQSQLQLKLQLFLRLFLLLLPSVSSSTSSSQSQVKHLLFLKNLERLKIQSKNATINANIPKPRSHHKHRQKTTAQ